VVWQWYVPPEIENKAGILVVIDSAEDPIPEDIKKIVDVKKFAGQDRHVGLKTLDITNLLCCITLVSVNNSRNIMPS
jgi:hypothetical protein